MSALSKVMDQARDAAAAAENAPANLPATQSYQSNVPANAPARPSITSMVDSAGIQVDEYLTVKPTGFRLGDMKGMFQSARVSIDMDEIVAIYQVRSTINGSTSFLKSYDGAVTNQGQNFAQATEAEKAKGGSVTGPYQTAEIPATLLEDVTEILPNGSKGPVTIKAGTTIGITPPVTGVKFFTKFVKKCAAANLQEATVEVNLVHAPQSNSNGNEWGVAEFELIGEAQQSE